MVWPIFISESAAPGPYVFSANALPAQKVAIHHRRETKRPNQDHDMKPLTLRRYELERAICDYFCTPP
jgi:hypothetical protein